MKMSHAGYYRLQQVWKNHSLACICNSIQFIITGVENIRVKTKNKNISNFEVNLITILVICIKENVSETVIPSAIQAKQY